MSGAPPTRPICPRCLHQTCPGDCDSCRQCAVKKRAN